MTNDTTEGLPDISGIDMNQSNLYGDVKSDDLFGTSEEKELDPDEVLQATKDLLEKKKSTIKLIDK